VLEYNGFNHYCINSPGKLTRYYAWKYRKLRQLGFEVVLIEAEEWERLERKEKQIEQLVAAIEGPLANKIGRLQQ
jgi:hypothetical protein